MALTPTKMSRASSTSAQPSANARIPCCAPERRSPGYRRSESAARGWRVSVSAEPPIARQVDAMIRCSTARRVPWPRACGLELGAVALTVVDTQRVAGEAVRPRDGERGRGIETAREQDDCALGQRPSPHPLPCHRRWGQTPRLGSDSNDRKRERGQCYLPGTLPQRYLCSWIWNRTGSRSARIQFASSTAGSCSWLGREQDRATSRKLMLGDELARSTRSQCDRR